MIRKTRFTESQIIGFLRETEAGMLVNELCCQHGFSEAGSTSGAASLAA